MRSRIFGIAALLFCLAQALLLTAPSSAQAWADTSNDVVTSSFSVKPVTVDSSGLRADLGAIATGNKLAWDVTAKANGLIGVADFVANDKSCVNNRDLAKVYIFHLSDWKVVSGSPSLRSSNWYVYNYSRFSRKGSQSTLFAAPLSGTGAPMIYGAKQLVIISIDTLDAPATLAENYALTIKQAIPDNLANAGALLSQLAGVSSKQAGAGGASVYAAAVCQSGTRKLPFDIQINSVATDGSATKAPAPTAGSASCAGSDNALPCATTRTFRSIDHEWWDFSGGVAVPGLRETSFSFDSKTNTTTPKVSRHTELYAFLDVFPFASILPKESGLPHLNFGVPLTTKSLYRPYFGISENLTGWTTIQRLLKLPVGINGIVGASWMKTQMINGPLPTTQSGFNMSLQYHRVWKPMFGIEVPLGSAASKAAKGKSS